MSGEDFAGRLAADAHDAFGPDWEQVLVERLGVASNTVRRWLRRGHKPRAKDHAAIDTVLGWAPGTTRDLLRRTQPERPAGTLEWLADALERNIEALERNTNALRQDAS